MAILDVLNSVSVADFKEQFSREFRYLPLWLSTTTYFINDKVYYDINNTFYLAKSQNTNQIPTNSTYWTPTADNILLYVKDAEIQKAINEAKDGINKSLQYRSDDFFKKMLLLLSAHILYSTLQGSSGGGGSNGLYETSRSVGSVSQSFTAPDYLLKNPAYSWYYKSPFGADYIAQMHPLFLINSFGRVDTNSRKLNNNDFCF